MAESNDVLTESFSDTFSSLPHSRLIPSARKSCDESVDHTDFAHATSSEHPGTTGQKRAAVSNEYLSMEETGYELDDIEEDVSSTAPAPQSDTQPKALAAPVAAESANDSVTMDSYSDDSFEALSGSQSTSDRYAEDSFDSYRELTEEPSTRAPITLIPGPLLPPPPAWPPREASPERPQHAASFGVAIMMKALATKQEADEAAKEEEQMREWHKTAMEEPIVARLIMRHTDDAQAAPDAWRKRRTWAEGREAAPVPRSLVDKVALRNLAADPARTIEGRSAALRELSAWESHAVPSAVAEGAFLKKAIQSTTSRLVEAKLDHEWTGDRLDDTWHPITAVAAAAAEYMKAKAVRDRELRVSAQLSSQQAVSTTGREELLRAAERSRLMLSAAKAMLPDHGRPQPGPPQAGAAAALAGPELEESPFFMPCSSQLLGFGRSHPDPPAGAARSDSAAGPGDAQEPAAATTAAQRELRSVQGQSRALRERAASVLPPATNGLRTHGAAGAMPGSAPAGVAAVGACDMAGGAAGGRDGVPPGALPRSPADVAASYAMLPEILAASRQLQGYAAEVLGR
eukprot:jgi/Tetstr1/459258/TSEL_000419.t1